MASYIFNITVNKPGAFNEYITTKLPLLDYINTSKGKVEIFCTRSLLQSELDTLTISVNSYTDPAEYLTLASQFTDSSDTLPVNSTTTVTVKTFIHQASYLGDGIFNTFKSVVKYTANVLPVSSSCILTLQLYCETRNFIMKTVTVDISSIIDEWKNSHSLGPFVKYQTIMISDLKSTVTNYDTICSIKGNISSPNIYFSLHSLQSLFYNIE